MLTIGLALILPVAIFCRGTMQMMRSATVRWVMLSSSINIELMLFAQLYWLKRVYNLEEQHFKVSVIKSIRGMLTNLEITKTQGLPMKKLIAVFNVNTYLVKIDTIPPKDTLQNYFTSELEDFDVWADCNAGLYNHYHKRYVYEYLSAIGCLSFYLTR